jgi:hypothetical protein
MTVTTSSLTRAAGAAAAAGGAIFVGVQIGHPQLSLTSITTTEVFVRDSLKIVMAVLGLAGITGMYLSQVRRNGVLGLIGYLVLSTTYLLLMCTSFLAAFVMPTVAGSSPGFVKDVIALSTDRGTITGDLGALTTMWHLQGYTFLAGGLLFGIALYRANVLARWASALLAVGGVVSVALTLLPDAFYRLLAFPNGIAMIGLGISLWLTSRRASAEDVQDVEDVQTVAARPEQVAVR